MLSFRVLGPLDVQRTEGDATEISLTRPLERRLLALLICNRRRVLSDDQAIEWLWPDARPASPERALQTSVSRLRKILGSTGSGSVVARKAGGYQMAIESHQIDSVRFEALIEGAAELAGTDRVIALHEALDLWRTTEAYSDFRYDDFAVAEASRLEDLRLGAYEDLLEARVAAGESDRVIPDIEIHLKEHPLRERLYHSLMLALYRSGRQAEALRAYQSARGHLNEELGIDPGPELARLEEQILLQDPGLELSEHRHAEPNNLPSRLNSIIGRGPDIERIQERLEEARLLTITGPGGVGKTTLALEVARHGADRHPGGIWFVSLEGLDDGSQVPNAIAAVLRRPIPGAGSERPSQVLDALADQLVGADLLLVIDNCEQVIDAVATTLHRLLATGDGLTVIATSRERLVVPGESVYPLEPLSPRAELSDTASPSNAIDAIPALRLFNERARATDPAFELTEMNLADAILVCQRLDGLPLAIELAAAQVATLSVSDIQRQLDGRFELLRAERAPAERHRTLEGAIEWSYQMLSRPDQRLLERLATLRTPFTIEVASLIVGTAEQSEIVPALARLRDKSLIQLDRSAAPDTRYELLRSIRAYATSKSQAAGTHADDARRHAEAFRALAQTAYPRTLAGKDQVTWLSLVSRAQPDFQVAVETLLELGEVDAALEIVADIGWVWFAYRRQDEGSTLVDKVLGAGGELMTRPAARVHTLGGGLAIMEGIDSDPASHQNRVAQRHFDAALGIAQHIGDPDAAAEAMVWSGYHRWFMGEADRALEILVPIRDQAAEQGFDRAVMFSSLAIGGVANLRSSYDEALVHIQRSLGIAHAAQDGLVQSLGYALLGGVLRDSGQYGAGAVAYHSGYLMAARFGFPMYTTVCAGGEAQCLRLDGQSEAARAAVQRALTAAATRPLAEAHRSFQNLMLDPRLGLNRAELAGRLHEIFGRPAPDRPRLALQLLMDLVVIHAARRNDPTGETAASAALADLTKSV